MRLGRQGVAGRAFGYAARAYVRTRLRRMAESSRPVLVGPWISEVGFELLYWVPFLRWASEAFGLPKERLIVLSRGGADPWYADLCGRYLDAFDALSVQQFRAENAARQGRTRGQKQMVATAFDGALVAWARGVTGAHDALVLHPALMHNLFRPFWWSAASTHWVRRHARFTRLAAPPSTALPQLPARYVAVKFYFNDGFPPTEENRQIAARILERVRAIAPVALLTTGLEIDEHREYTTEGVIPVADACVPRNNLTVQSAVVASAQAFVGTYGGFSYLAPGYGVPTVAVYADARRFFHTHLKLAREVFPRDDWTALDVSSTSAGAIDAAVRRVASA